MIAHSSEQTHARQKCRNSGSAWANLDEPTYMRLRLIASRLLVAEQTGRQLEAADLIHEATLRLAHTKCNNAKHVVALYTLTMRRILVDMARHRVALKRAGELTRVPLEGNTPPATRDTAGGDLHDALRRMKSSSPRQARVLIMHFAHGWTLQEIASLLEVSDRTVKRDIRSGRQHLTAEMGIRCTRVR